jgi:hypothetical protein
MSFALGQGVLQCLQLISGLLLVWLLSVPHFAMYAIFTGAMGFSSLMIGFGLAPTVMALVGANFERKDLVGRYLAAAWYLRMWMFIPVTAFGIVFIVYTGSRIDCATVSLVCLGVALTLSNFVAAQTDLLAVPLRMSGRLSPLYLFASGAESVKLLFVGCLWSVGVLSAVTAAIATVVGGFVNYILLRRCSRTYLMWPRSRPLREQQELWHLISPRLPNMIFGALQGQITIAVASMVGSTHQIASVGALARLARLIEFLQAANAMVVGPLIAKTSVGLIWTRISFVLLVAAGIGCLVALSGWVAPDLLLLVLGPKYRNLGDIVWIVTLAAGMGYFASVLTTVASYRRWISWWASFATIGLVLAAQGVVAASVDLRTVAGVLLLGIAAELARVVVLAAVLWAARWRPMWLRDPNRIGS